MARTDRVVLLLRHMSDQGHDTVVIHFRLLQDFTRSLIDTSTSILVAYEHLSQNRPA